MTYGGVYIQMPNCSAISVVISWLISEITVEIKLDRNSPISLITIFMRQINYTISLYIFQIILIKITSLSIYIQTKILTSDSRSTPDAA